MLFASTSSISRLARISSLSPSSLSTLLSPPTRSSPSPLLPRPFSSSPILSRRWDKDYQYDRVKRTHYDIDKYPVHVRKRIAAQRARDRQLYNPYKVEPLREDENEQFIKNHFDSKQMGRDEVNDGEDSPFQDVVSFADLGLNSKLVNLLLDDGYSLPKAIQAAVIPNALQGRDIIGVSLTGSGKTLAYVLPIVQKRIQSLRAYQKLLKYMHLGKPAPIHFLVLCPTRELAMQIRADFLKLKIRAALAVGGQIAKTQIPEIRQSPILIATPGRLLEYIEGGVVDLSGLRMFVLDEADKMLNMGFFEDVEKVCEAIRKGRSGRGTKDRSKSKTNVGGGVQTLMLSATLPRQVLHLAKEILVDPVELDIRGDRGAVESVQQYTIYTKGMHDKTDKLKELLEYIHKHDEHPRVLLFCNAKREVNHVTKHMVLNTNYTCHPLHSDLSFAARSRALKLFKEGGVQLLIATDLVSRGIDFQAVTHVINYNLPTEPETFIHRIGRTGRGDATGVAINLMSQFGTDAVSMEKIQEAMKISPKVVKEEMIYSIFQEEP